MPGRPLHNHETLQDAAFEDILALPSGAPAVPVVFTGFGSGTTVDWQLVSASGVDVYWQAGATPNSFIGRLVIPPGFKLQARPTAAGQTVFVQVAGEDFNWNQEG